MVVSKPKSQALTALSLFVLAVFVVFFMLLDSLLSNDQYFWIKIILTPVLLVIGLFVLGKLLEAIKQVRCGDSKIELFYPVSRKKVIIKVSDVLGWKEEVVKTKQGEYREVKVAYGKKGMLRLSNREHTNYERVVGYLKKKIKNRR